MTFNNSFGYMAEVRSGECEHSPSYEKIYILANIQNYHDYKNVHKFLILLKKQHPVIYMINEYPLN
ncbi:hypothetical protein pb186bvf_007949 [Paramecium bursaria]